LILDHRGDPGISFEYLVRWADGTESWEPAHGFYDTECIRTYWRTRSSKLKKTTKSTKQKSKVMSTLLSSDFSGGDGDNSDSESNIISQTTIPHNNKAHTSSNIQSEQSLLQQFVDKFIQNHQLTSRKLQLRKNALDIQLENEISKSNLRFTFGDVVHRLRKTLREQFPQ
jgi:hypothetical protein